MLTQLGRQQRSFSALHGWLGGVVKTAQLPGGTRVNASVWAVTGDFFTDLGVRPVVGRVLRSEDVDLHEAAKVAPIVVGHAFWRSHLGGTPDGVGQTIEVAGVHCTVVGVAPAGFTGLGAVSEADIVVPLNAFPSMTEGTSPLLSSRRAMWVNVTGRLGPGVSIEQARASLETLWPSVKQATAPSPDAGQARDDFLATRLAVVPGARGSEPALRSQFGKALYAVGALAIVALLVACINVATLAIARADQKRREMAIQTALGAAPWRIVFPSLIESMCLGALGVITGCLLSVWAAAVLRDLLLGDFIVPTVLNTAPRVTSIAVALAGGLLAVVFLSAPVARAVPTRATLLPGLRDGYQLTSRGRLGKTILICQFALSIVLLVNAATLLHSLTQLRTVQTGFDAHGVFIVSLTPRDGTPATMDSDSYQPALVERILSVQGVTAVTLSNLPPGVAVERREKVVPAGSAEGDSSANFCVVSPGWFRTLRVPLLRGRDLKWSDRSQAARVAVVSVSLAERLFAGGDPIGRRIGIGQTPERQGIEIVGVVGNTRPHDRRDATNAAIYVPSLQEPDLARSNFAIVRCESDRESAMKAVAAAVQHLGKDDVLMVRSLDQIEAHDRLGETLAGIIGGMFAAAAVLLTLIGLSGSIAHSLSQRRTELSIRTALGAAPAMLTRMVLSEVLTLIAIATLIGLPLSFSAARLLRGFVYGVSSWDAGTAAAAVLLLLAVSVLTAYVPARRVAEAPFRSSLLG